MDAGQAKFGFFSAYKVLPLKLGSGENHPFSNSMLPISYRGTKVVLCILLYTISNYYMQNCKMNLV